MARGEFKLSYTTQAALTVGGAPITLSVIYKMFSIGDQPQQTEDFGKATSYSTNGNYNIGGISFKEPLKWLWTARISTEDIATQMAMYEHMQLARRNGLPCVAILDDETERIPQTPTKTRTSVSGTTDVTANGVIYTYSRFQVYMPTKPILGYDSGVGTRSIVITLEDTGVII